MPPTPGMFAVPHSSQRARNGDADYYLHPSTSMGAGPSRSHGASAEDQRREKRRREFGAKMDKEMNDRRGESRTYIDNIQSLHNTSLQLSSRPETSSAFLLQVYPLSLQRSALLVQHELEEHAALEAAQQMFDMERARVEDEYKRGRERVRERMLEGIEEKRRRAREERDGDALGDAAAGGALDAQTRPGATRKLRGKLASPPPQDMPQPAMGAATGAPSNPHSLAIDELPSAFPLPLTAVTLPQSGQGAQGAQGQNRRRAKGAGGPPQPAFGMLGKSVLSLTGCKESEIEADLSDITRGNKRRRTAAGGSGNK